MVARPGFFCLFDTPTAVSQVLVADRAELFEVLPGSSWISLIGS